MVKTLGERKSWKLQRLRQQTAFAGLKTGGLGRASNNHSANRDAQLEARSYSGPHH